MDLAGDRLTDFGGEHLTNRIRSNWERFQERLWKAAERAERDPREITVVAVTKTRQPEEIDAIVDCGIEHVGENRVQEAESKRPLVSAKTTWHLVGHLQTNKIKKAVGLFDIVQSVDNLRVAHGLNDRAGRAGRRLDVLIQVNTSGTSEQSGVSPERVEELAGELMAMEHLQTTGLMTIGAMHDDERVVRACFSRLRETRDNVVAAFADSLIHHLSMGMSGDFEWAVAEGATMLRIGTSLFGPRQN